MTEILLIAMLKCRVVSVETRHVVIRPLSRDFDGMVGNLKCDKKKLRRKRKPAVGDMIVAYEVQKNKKGWRAKKGALIE